MSPTILVPPKIIAGADSIDALGRECAAIGRRALVMTGRTALRRAGITERIERVLADAGVEAELFERVEPEPSCATCDAGRALLRERGCDLVVGAGGGSAMDAAKVVAGLANEDAPTVTFWEGRKVERAGIPFVALPTTSGTGSEATKNGVITNPAVPAKTSIRDDAFVARLVVLDPKLTLSVPPKVTAESGMDALVQAIESFTSIHANPVTDAWAFESARLLADSVLAAFRNGSDLAARTDAAYGSLLAGMALANARLGLVHGLAHPLGARHHIPHGLVCAVLIPAVMRFNRDAAAEKYARLDAVMHGDALAHFEHLRDAMNIPRDLRSFVVRPDDVDLLVEESLPSGSLKANPRRADAEDCARILRSLL